MFMLYTDSSAILYAVIRQSEGRPTIQSPLY